MTHKLGRRWLGIEIGEHFREFYDDDRGERRTGVVGRMKEVLAGRGNHEPCGISREVNWQGGGFFKYFDLEQYEDALVRARYEDADLFDDPDPVVRIYHPIPNVEITVTIAAHKENSPLPRDKNYFTPPLEY